MIIGQKRNAFTSNSKSADQVHLEVHVPVGLRHVDDEDRAVVRALDAGLEGRGGAAGPVHGAAGLVRRGEGGERRSGLVAGLTRDSPVAVQHFACNDQKIPRFANPHIL